MLLLHTRFSIRCCCSSWERLQPKCFLHVYGKSGAQLFPRLYHDQEPGYRDATSICQSLFSIFLFQSLPLSPLPLHTFLSISLSNLLLSFLPPSYLLLSHPLCLSLFLPLTSPSPPLKPTVMHLACVNLHMSMPEALAAATINAAAALGLSDKYGSIEPGKRGDLLIINAAR